MIRHIELIEVDWIGIKAKIPVGDTDEDEKKREAIWGEFDPNQNGLVSLAEADLAFRRMAGPLLPIYYSKKVQLLAFNNAKSSQPGEKDSDNDDRLKVNDFIEGINLLRLWGADIKDSKDAKRWFYKYDDNRGGVILMDEWVLFADEHKLDIEKNEIIKEVSRKPMRIYKKHDYLKAGDKRPSQAAKLNTSKSPQSMKIDFDLEINLELKKQQKKLRTGEYERLKIDKNKPQPLRINKKLLNPGQYKSQEEEDELTYDQMEKEIKEMDEENYLLTLQYNQLKQELKRQRKLIGSLQIVL